MINKYYHRIRIFHFYYQKIPDIRNFFDAFQFSLSIVRISIYKKKTAFSILRLPFLKNQWKNKAKKILLRLIQARGTFIYPKDKIIHVFTAGTEGKYTARKGEGSERVLIYRARN